MVTDAATVNEDDPPAAEQPLDETVWAALIESVIEGECTPFLGAGRKRLRNNSGLGPA
jgi:hypothetical protein